jgi:cytochrome c-type biogenesis protein CcmH/NrfG
MTETRETLEARKRDLFTAIRTLDADFEEGTLDASVYRESVDRYEREAAEVLAQLDALSSRDEPASTPSRPRRSRVTAGLAAGAVAAVIVILLLGAVQRRAEDRALGASARPAATQPTSKGLVKAQQAVLKNPRSPAAQMALGNAYLKLGESAQADSRYREAMMLAPEDPQPATLHAMVLGSGSRPEQALTVLARVERSHPRYARAWLLDGVLSSHSRSTYARAIHAWNRFLSLQPASALAPTVRRWIAATKGAERRAR